MQLPRHDAHYSERINYGIYVACRLGHERSALAADIRAVTYAVEKAGEELDLLRRPVEALADRDAAGDELVAAAQQVRLSLAGRGADAMKRLPYTRIFSGGMEYFTAAPLHQEVRRYGQLRNRVTQLLPANDPVRVSAVAALTKGIAAVTAATTALKKAQMDEALVTKRLKAAEEAFDREVQRVYGVLLAEVGRAAADRFFPRMRPRRQKRTTARSTIAS